MIIRIMTEGQYRFPGAMIDDLNDIDHALVDVVADDNQAEFERLFSEMLEMVRKNGSPLADDELEESDAVLPEPDITLEEAKELFVGTGVVPG